jgi:U-box domain
VAITTHTYAHAAVLLPHSHAHRKVADQQVWASMQAPEDLRCPITHSVFRSPVVTSVGTVYEEAAINKHLESSATDPLSNQHIEDKRLIPVFVLRSRAKQV